MRSFLRSAALRTTAAQAPLVSRTRRSRVRRSIPPSQFDPTRRYREATASDSIAAATESPRIATWRGEDTSAYIGAAAWTE